MTVFNIGRVCRKTTGQEAGKLCVVLSKPTEGKVAVAGPNIKKITVNIKHLEPLPNTVTIDKDAGQMETTKALKNEGLIL